MTGAGRQWGEAGLIYEASSDGTTWQGGHSRQTLGDKSPEVCEQCKQWEVDTPAPPYQPETPRTGQDKAAILDGRRYQGLPGPDLALPTSQPRPLILPHIATPSPLLRPSLPQRSYFITEPCPTRRLLSRQTCSRSFPAFLRLSFIAAPRSVAHHGLSQAQPSQPFALP